MHLDTRIRIEIIDDEGDHEDWGVEDMRDASFLQKLVLGFGNGIIEEARVVGLTKAGIFAFVNLLGRGGYRTQASGAKPDSVLYRPGDACFPHSSPYIFIAPTAENGDVLDFENYAAELDAFTREASPGESAE